MKRIYVLLCGALIACCCTAKAFAGEGAMSGMSDSSDMAAPAADAYGYNPDDQALNQAVVVYWLAHGYANAFGNFPANYAELAASGIVLREFKSPFNGEAIDPDDGSLDFDGDMTYSAGDGCSDVSISVQTSGGPVMVPGSMTATSDISGQYGPCCCPNLCGGCCDPTICGTECWNLCPGEEATCKIIQWILWKSFELHKCLYGAWPANEQAWMASGLAPVASNYKEMAPNMDIEFVYTGGDCCMVKKAKVHCCPVCNSCNKCDSCNKCNKCESGCKKCEKSCGCDKCGTKSSSCDKCGTKTSTCEKGCGCDKCKSKCNSCNKCATKSSCDKCGTKSNKCEKGCGCDKCKTKCNSCNKCDKCESKCNKCEKNCGCDKCKSSSKCGCDKCKSSGGCGKCDKCKSGGCDKCH